MNHTVSERSFCCCCSERRRKRPQVDSAGEKREKNLLLPGGHSNQRANSLSRYQGRLHFLDTLHSRKNKLIKNSIKIDPRNIFRKRNISSGKGIRSLPKVNRAKRRRSFPCHHLRMQWGKKEEEDMWRRKREWERTAANFIVVSEGLGRLTKLGLEHSVDNAGCTFTETS